MSTLDSMKTEAEGCFPKERYLPKPKESCFDPNLLFFISYLIKHNIAQPPKTGLGVILYDLFSLSPHIPVPESCQFYFLVSPNSIFSPMLLPLLPPLGLHFQWTLQLPPKLVSQLPSYPSTHFADDQIWFLKNNTNLGLPWRSSG